MARRAESVLEKEGPERAHYLLEKLIEKARRSGAYIPFNATTAYINTIPPSREERSPGDAELEHKIRSLVRWNAMAMVVRANKESSELGGHIASFASAATLYDVGFNHFFRAANDNFGGDLVYFQGHSAPGIYARAYLEGRISEEQLDHSGRKSAEKDSRRIRIRGSCRISGSSPPYPWGWDRSWRSIRRGSCATCGTAASLTGAGPQGLGVYGRRRNGRARIARRDLACRHANSSTISIFVINCNLQRLDGPVRGNGKIIQELEADFRGAGWNVIKVIWGSYWDPLIRA